MRFFLLLLPFASMLAAQTFVGVSAGLSTLSADAAKSAGSFSQYKPENGAAVSLFAGRHISDWWSAQASYGWNRNSVLLSGIAPTGSYDVPLRSTMHTFMGEAQFYFRPRSNRIRPYLSAGPGIAAERATSAGLPQGTGRLGRIESSLSKNSFAFRVAVGLDARLSNRVSLRYSFGETLQSNLFSLALVPAGSRKLANFQNQWGLVWRF